MIRVLLIILAIVSAVVAAVVGVSLLYFVALALVVAAGALSLVRMKGKFDVGKPDSSGYSRVEPEDLSSFGILEIRPKARNGSATTETASVEDDDGHAGHFETEARADPPGSDAGRGERSATPAADTAVSVSTAEPARGPRVDGGHLDTFIESNHRTSSLYQVISVIAELDADVLGPCLESLATALNANSVAVIRVRGGEYRMLAIVSQNAYARGAGVVPVTSFEPFKTPGKGNIVVESVSRAVWEATDLKYYRGEIAVREVARAEVTSPQPDEVVVLIADSVRRGVLETQRSKELLRQYARLLGMLLDPGKTERGALRPRREIIAEEIDDARHDGYPLALALVLLNRADDFKDAAAIAHAESVLVGRLLASGEGLRVERFGDLMVGVFHRSDTAAVETWAARIQAELATAEGPLSGGVSVGAAVMTDRHSSPEMLRADAAAALQEALESGTCTIIPA